MMDTAWPKRILCGQAWEQLKCPGNAASRLVNRGRVFGHPGKRTPRSARGTSYRRWRLCLRSEAPKLFLPISALLLNGRTADYLSRAQIISRRFTINMLEFQSSKNEGKGMKK